MKLIFIGQDTILNGMHIKHGKDYYVRTVSARRGVIKVMISDGKSSCICPYDSIESFLDNWEDNRW